MSNPATRLLDLLRELHKGDGNVAGIQQWIRMLKLEGDHAQEDAIAAMQEAMGQLRILEAQLRRLGVPEHLYSKALTRVREAFNPLQANGAWAQIGAHAMNPEHNIALRWAQWATRDFREPEIEAEALTALLASIEAQEKVLAEGGLTPAIHDLLLRQTQELRRALGLTIVTGVAPLREVCKHGVTEFALADRDDLAGMNEKDEAAIKNGAGMLKRAAEIAKAGGEVVEFFSRVASSANSVLTYVQTLLPHNE